MACARSGERASGFLLGGEKNDYNRENLIGRAGQHNAKNLSVTAGKRIGVPALTALAAGQVAKLPLSLSGSASVLGFAIY
jgi:hypothetical protein